MRQNIVERGIDFADVLVAFVDPDRRVVEDTRKDYGETRSPRSKAGSSISPIRNVAR